MCHLLLLFPLVALPVFWVLPVAVALSIYVPVLVVSLWFYWFAIQAMRRPIVAGREELLHASGQVLAVGDRAFLIRVHGEIWTAVSSDRVAPGDVVEVTGAEGLTLHVRRTTAQPVAKYGTSLGAGRSLTSIGAAGVDSDQSGNPGHV